MKCALYRLPLGGAKGGVICNPKELSAGEMERPSRCYVKAMTHFIGSDCDIAAPDVGTNAQTILNFVPGGILLLDSLSPGR